MRELIVVLKDDFDHTQLADKTIPYTWAGVPLEIDLSAEHAAEFEELMRPYVAVSRKAKRKKAAAKSPAAIAVVNGDGTLSPVKRHSKEEQAGKALRDRVRKYAQEQGIQQAQTGYLRRASVDAWLLEHPEHALALGRS